METTLILLKPDTIERSLIWKVINRIEKKWLKIAWLKMMQLDDEIINTHYDFLTDKPFFPRLKAYMQRTPVVAIAVSWSEAVKIVRDLAWATNPAEAQIWTIRWDFGLSIDWNIMHASDSVENAQKELQRFFQWNWIYEYKKITDDLL